MSLDDLFGLNKELTQDQITQAYRQALELFAISYDEGEKYVEAETRAHWSNVHLLRLMAAALFAQIPTLEGSSDRPLTGTALKCACAAERLFRRTIALTPRNSIPSSDVTSLSMILQWTGQETEARSLLDGLVAKEPSLAAVSLSQLLRESGDREAALTVLQRALLIALVEAQASLSALALNAADDQLESIVGLSRNIQSLPNFVSLFPTLMPTVLLEQARRALADNDTAAALHAFIEFSDCVDEACSVMIEPKNPLLFDHVTDMMWSEAANEEELVARKTSARSLRTSYVHVLETDETFSQLRDMPEFQTILKQLRADADTKE